MSTPIRVKLALVGAGIAFLAALTFYLVPSSVSTPSEEVTVETRNSKTLSSMEITIPQPGANARFNGQPESTSGSSVPSPLTLVTERHLEIQAAIAKLLEEDLQRMSEVLQLSDAQFRLVRAELVKVRMSSTLEIGGEKKVLKRILTPQQLEHWDADIARQERVDAENYATSRVRDIGRTISDLTEEQKNSLFTEMAGTVLGDSHPDEEILGKILTPDQFAKWIVSPESTPERLVE